MPTSPESIFGEVGVCLPVRRFTAAATVELGVEAAAMGFANVWISELCSYDAVAVAAALAAQTTTVRIGTSVIPSATRSPALLAMAAATLASLAPGRAVLGLGASTPAVIDGWHGLSSERPRSYMDEVLDVLRQALEGWSTHHDGPLLRSHGFLLDVPPDPPPRILLGALGPAMRRLARERVHGVILNFVPRSVLPEVIAAEKDGHPEHEVALMVRGLGGEPGSEERFRKELASYARIPAYRRWFDELGFAAPIDAALRHDSLSEIGAALPDDLVADIAVVGGGAQGREQLREITRAGATALLVPVCAAGDSVTCRQVLRAYAQGGNTPRDRNESTVVTGGDRDG